MPTEIERKFLVIGDGWRTDKGIRIRQGYLNRERGRIVRVRIAGDNGYITIKGITTGISRAEFEYAIPAVDAGQLLQMCDGRLIEKVRHVVVHKGTSWEVDEFHGDNSGLLMAEVELEFEEQTFEKPVWLGAEVTGDVRYYNSYLSQHPYASW
ncbi:MAG: CYTH domain-containing protein [Anaerolineae bacterium]|nr:CYTH domain-containing protein [Anaerolineae bacterium]MDK1118488.1 CYTH domain-containing protein [Anaerolineae bacterium]